MKILFDGQIFTIQQYGGISRYFFELANALSDEGQQVWIDAPFHINRYIDGSRLTEGRRLRPLRGVTRFCQAANGILAARRIRRFSPAIVHETYFSADAGRDDIPHILTVYDMIHELFVEGGRGDALGLARRAAVMRADHIICISENTRRDLINILGVDEDRTSVIHLAASLSARDDLPVPVDAPYILYVGPRDRYKNFDCLLRAYAAIPRLVEDFRLVCFGGGALHGEERNAIRQLGIPDGRVLQVSGSDRALAAAYRHASAFVYPSLYEGFGIPPLEAMQCDCPVICSDRSSLPEVVGKAAYLFDPTSPEALGAAMERLLYDAQLRELYILSGRERAAGFSWERCASQTLAVYRQHAGSTG